MAKEGFVAHVFDTIKSGKRSRVSTYDKIKDFKKGKNIQVSFDKKATKYQLKDIKEKLQKENTERFTKILIIISVLILILVYVIGFVKF